MHIGRIALLFCSAALALAGEAGWRPLLNGTDLSGWETYLAKPPKTAAVDLPKDEKGEYTQPLGVNRDPLHAFTIVMVDGEPTLRVTGDIAGGIATLESFSNYHLRLQFKWGALQGAQKPEQLRNSGILYHGFGEHGEGNGRWLNSHQFQVQNGYCGDWVAVGAVSAEITARKIDEKRFGYDPSAEPKVFSNTPPEPSRCARAAAEESPLDGWNTLELICIDDTSIHVVNGRVVLRARLQVRETQGAAKPLLAGRIEFQSEGWEVYFRRVEIRPIGEVPKPYRE